LPATGRGVCAAAHHRPARHAPQKTNNYKLSKHLDPIISDRLDRALRFRQEALAGRVVVPAVLQPPRQAGDSGEKPEVRLTLSLMKVTRDCNGVTVENEQKILSDPVNLIGFVECVNLMGERGVLTPR